MVKITNTLWKTNRFTSCFRQWKAEGTHCRFTHAYKIWFELTFNTDLKDYPELCNYIHEWFELTFNYKTFVASDDPELESFKYLHTNKIIDLVELPQVGCERFSEFVLDNINKILSDFGVDSRCIKVETWEHDKNSGIALL
jgi:6-pyruvoyltetrahydropterin/6-carboxytetrahydropterin synthase